MKPSALSLCAAGALIFASCGTNDISRSGFLDSYSQLGPDITRRDAAAVYLNPTVDFNQFDSLIIDPITVIPASVVMSELEKEQIAARLHAAFASELKKDYKIVSQPGPKTIRLRAAITGDLSSVTGTPESFTYPNAKVTDGLPYPSPAAKHVGSALVEVEMLDSGNGNRLVALAEKRLGDVRPDLQISTWNDISRLMNTAGLRTRQRLTDLRARLLD